MDSVVYIDGKAYRRGYTTGTTATAAAVAAALLALGDDAQKTASVRLPSGSYLEIPVTLHPPLASAPGLFTASAVKDGGDDIDQTNGLEIIVTIKLREDHDILISGGQGVGKVTKPGLQVPVGQWAINPVPRQMILDNLRRVLGDHQGAELTISIPGGEAAAKKTFNPKLGIEGGISIIGTTGIVEPMSEEAWKKSLEIELRQLRLTGETRLILVPGNHGEKYAVEKLGLDGKLVVTMSNFVGYMLMAAVTEGFREVLMVGHSGKLVKLAAGVFHTHSRVADARAEAIVAALVRRHAPMALIQAVLEANTTDEASDLINAADWQVVFEDLAQLAAEKAEAHTYDAISVDVVLYDMKGRCLGVSKRGMAGFKAAEQEAKQ